MAAFFSQSKLYTISLFASLNNRDQLREKTTVSKDIPLSLPGQPIKFSTISTTRGQFEDDPTKTSQSVMVTIERKVETEGKDEP